MLLALILSLSVGPVLVTAAWCEWGYLKFESEHYQCEPREIAGV